MGRLLSAAFVHRRLLAELVRRDVRGRFAGSRFGLLWSVLNPAVQLASYAAIFGFVYRATDAEPRGQLLATLFCGLWPWWAFQEGTTHGLTALVDHAALLRKTPIPPAVCVLSAVLASFLLQAIGFALFLALFLLSGMVTLRPELWLLPLAMLAGLLLTAGAALVLAPVYLVVRDTIHVVTATLTLLFFASPVLYRLDALPERLRAFAELSPVATVIGLHRAAVLAFPMPSALPLVSCLAALLLSWFLGALLLARLEGFLDEYW